MLSMISIALCIAAVFAADPPEGSSSGDDSPPWSGGRLNKDYGVPNNAPAGYTLEGNDVGCETMGGPCDGQQIFFEGETMTTGKNTDTDSTNFAACKTKCEEWNGCMGFSYVYNVGMYDTSSKLGKCVGKSGRNSQNLQTSRFGQAFYLRDDGAVTGQIDWNTKDLSKAAKNAVGAAVGMATGLLIAVIVVPIVGIILLVVCIVCCCKQCNKNKAVNA